MLVNPSAGRGKARQAMGRLRELAARVGAPVEVSRDAPELVALARQAVSDGVERLLVAGGDGTFHHAAQALVGSSCALGLIPLGRGNDLAADLGVTMPLESAVEFALAGSPRRMDVGRVGRRYFVGYCGMGFDSESARYARAAPAILGGTLAYVYGVLRTLMSFEPPTFAVGDAGERFEGRAMFVVVCNISRFGGGMRIAPAARPDDGRLDLVVARELSRLQLLRVFPKVYRGDHIDHPAVLTDRVETISVAADRSISIACDGEPVGSIDSDPVEISVVPAALTVIAR